MRFVYPHLLWLALGIVPAFYLFFRWADRKREALMTRFIQARLLPQLTVGISKGRRQLKQIAFTSAAILLLVALARPQWGFDWEEARLRGLDIVVAIDVSKSMLAEDVAPNRLMRAKLAALDLLAQAKSDRLGLVAFAGSAFLQCPLTIDEAAFRQSVEALDVNIIPEGGTALAEAIQVALTAFKEAENHKVLVLLTDGEDQDSGALEAAKKAAEAGLKIYTVGIGTAEGEVLRLRDAKGRTDYVRDERGDVVKSHLNEELLREIALATGGGSFLLRGGRTIETLYADFLSKLPKSDRQERLAKHYHEQYAWPLGAAILLLLFEMLLPERSGAKPVQKSTAAGVVAGAKASTASLLFLIGVMIALGPERARASAGQALRDYKEGNYQQSQQQYEELLKRKPDDPRLHYNAGAAAYRNRQFDEAFRQFSDALTSPDLKVQGQAYYNRGNALYYLGENAPDPAKRTESWKKSVQDFESSLKLNPQDPDAKFNRDLVKKRLEELQQQQQQQKQQQNKDNQDDQKQDQQKQQPSQGDKDQQKQSQEQQQNSSQQPEEQQGQQKEQQPQPQQQGDQQQKESQPQPGQEEQQQAEKQPQQGAGKPAEDSPEQQREGQAANPGQMTPQEAQQLLDSQKDDEKMLPIKPTGKPQNVTRPVRDW